MPLPWVCPRAPLPPAASCWKKNAGLLDLIRTLVDNDTAGCTVTGQLWVRLAIARLVSQLRKSGHAVGERTAARLLRSLDCRLRVNRKSISSCSHEQRNAQFEKIALLRARSTSEGIPVISVDARKKELIGRFRNDGGSKGCRPRAWKYFLKHRLADPFNLTVTVAHCPAGASKWNPVEHRLFGEFAKQWAGVVLESVEIMLQCLRETTTKTGLTVTAELVEGTYEKGIAITDRQLKALNCVKDRQIPNWNYSIMPAP